MNPDSGTNRRLEPVPAEMNPANGKALALVLGAVPLLLAKWFIVATILGHGCVVPYEGGNITECGGGLSEEATSAASGLLALVMLVIQIGLIVLATRRTRSRPH
ncbi:hypothetical protein [Acrocarpospora phusangensis]|nr:hypothetical protein [Acrocarpospora phusangensis]